MILQFKGIQNSLCVFLIAMEGLLTLPAKSKENCMKYKKLIIVCMLAMLLTACSCGSSEKLVDETDSKSTDNTINDNESESLDASEEDTEDNSSLETNVTEESAEEQSSGTEEAQTSNNKDNESTKKETQSGGFKETETTTSVSTDKTEDETYQPELKQQYGITDCKYEYNQNYLEYKVIYPQFKNDVYKINDKLKTFAMEYVNEVGFEKPEAGELEKRQISENYYIKLINKDILSICMEGFINVYGTAHPTLYIRTITIDLNTGKELNVKELVADKAAFREQFMKAGKEQLPAELYNELLRWEELDSVEKQLSDAEYYLTENGIGLYFYISYAAGSYFYVEVPDI